MRPLTDTCPKPLLQAGGKPLIVWHLERLRDAGFKAVIINHAHLGGQIEAALGDGRRYGVDIHYSAEREALETAGGIRKALPLLGNAPFLVINGDIFCEVDLAELRASASSLAIDRDLAHLVLVPNPAHKPGGDFVLDRDRVREDGPARLTFSGIGIYHPTLFSHLRSGERAKLAPLLRRAICSGRVSGALYSGCWLDVGTPQRLEQLDRHLTGRTGD